jgi:nitrate reductase assembly molybdenum cofactor insertion protein NarJ
MDSLEKAKSIILGFADIMTYPGKDYLEIIQKLDDTLAESHPDIALEFKTFTKYSKEVPLSRLEEIYSNNFDISPACYVYAGYQLFGEGYKRNEFIVGLKAKFREYGFEYGNELPDHFRILLRFLAEIELFEDTAVDMMRDCMLPTLDKMIKGIRQKQEPQNPYYYVLRAIEIYLKKCVEETEKSEEEL